MLIIEDITKPKYSPSAYAAVADLVHHLRADLSAAQLARITHVYATLIHNPYLTSNLHTLFAKMMFTLIEAVLARETPHGAARVIGAIFETCFDKLEAVAAVADGLEKLKKGNPDEVDIALIEKMRPVAGAVYAVEKPEDAIAG